MPVADGEHAEAIKRAHTVVGSGEAQERGIIGETRTSRHACRALPSRTSW